MVASYEPVQAHEVSLVLVRQQSRPRAAFAQEKEMVREAPTLPPLGVQILLMRLSLSALPVRTQRAILAKQQVLIYGQRQ
jgi:hypothetical protein